MMKRSILLSVLLILSITLQAQKEKYIRNDLLLDKAHTLAAQSPGTALVYYDSAFVLIKWNGSDYLEAAITALGAGRDDRANNLLIAGAENGLDPWIFYIPILKEFLASDRSQPFVNTWDYMKQRFNAHADTASIHEIEWIIEMRRNNPETAAPLANIDSICFDRTIELTRRSGFPSPMTVGPSINAVYFMLVANEPTYPDGSQWKEILPAIQAAIASGRISPSFLCELEDLRSLHLGRPIKYGTLIGSWLGKKGIVKPERSVLNRDRASVGLGPVEDLAVQHDLDPVTLEPK